MIAHCWQWLIILYHDWLSLTSINYRQRPLSTIHQCKPSLCNSSSPLAPAGLYLVGELCPKWPSWSCCLTCEKKVVSLPAVFIGRDRNDPAQRLWWFQDSHDGKCIIFECDHQCFICNPIKILIIHQVVSYETRVGLFVSGVLFDCLFLWLWLFFFVFLLPVVVVS